MKSRYFPTILALVLAGGANAFAQSSNTVPGPNDYAAFSRFITDRNIFDPNRQPHYSGHRIVRTQTLSPAAPAFSLVGTMGYEKGWFAFFNGNSGDLKKVLPESDSIAGYRVREIVPGRVKLESTDKKEQLELKVGDVMRQENGKWQLTGAGEIAGDGSGASSSTEAAAPAASAAASPAGEPNDILKRLMQRREQENQ